MYIAKIIYPENARKRLSCDSCDCSYNTKDYKILLDNNKIKYFKVESTFISNNSISLCHGCLLDSAKSIADGDKITFVIQAEEHEYVVEFSPEEPEDDGDGFIYDDGDDDDDDTMDDFLKDLK